MSPPRGRFRNVTVLCNPSSGRGRAAHVDAAVRSELARAGFVASAFSIRPGLPPDALRSALRGADLLVIIGGDGTLHHALPDLIESGVPVFHVPLGTENLFAREFSMSRTPGTLVDALHAGEVTRIDVGKCGPSPFALMLSLGFDASIVQRVAARRAGAITRLSYLRHALSELAAPTIPVLTIDADERRVVDARPGVVFVCNCRQYGGRLNPAPRADMRDALLDLVFLPIQNRIGMIAAVLRLRAGLHLDAPGTLAIRAANIRISTSSTCPMQIDGEHAGVLAPAQSGAALEIRCMPAALRVLLPGPHAP